MKRIDYFPWSIPIRKQTWKELRLGDVMGELSLVPGAGDVLFFRHLSLRYRERMGAKGGAPGAGELMVFTTILRVYHYLLDRFSRGDDDAASAALLSCAERGAGKKALSMARCFVDLFPGKRGVEGADSTALFPDDESLPPTVRKEVAREIFLLRIANMNRATASFRELHRDDEFLSDPIVQEVVSTLFEELDKGPLVPPFGVSLVKLFLSPIGASPDSLTGQLEYIRREWASLLPPELLKRIGMTLKILEDEEAVRGAGGPGPPVVWQFDREDDYGYPEYARYTEDTDWMPNTVLLAKMVFVWLYQLSHQYGRPITRLNDIPDEELDRLARWGFNGLWLIGIWERSPASKIIKEWSGKGGDGASAYSIFDYSVAERLGGWEALHDLKNRAWERGIRLACDMVPNHTGIYSRWVVEHPDWFIHLDYPPYPRYSFTGPDLSGDGRVTIQLEDGYYDQSDAAVVFKLTENDTGRVRYIYHGNDGTSTPWNDTAQLNYLLPEVREELIRVIMRMGRMFPIIRFDAAMTLTKKHFQRLWYPAPGQGPSIPSRAEGGMTRRKFDENFPEEFWREVVDRAAREASDTLMIAEAFWLMESYFVRTLGMHRVYNSAFMHMLKLEDNAGYRRTVKNILQFDPRILQRLVNFMNNPDEMTAVEQFGKGDKYFGVAVLLVTMPGLPMFGHGQVEGYEEKYGMEYTQPHLGEAPDRGFLSYHEEKIFPLLRRRRLFSGAEHFTLYDFFSGNEVNENVIAFSNMVGNERSIVAYHNRYADTKGWIRTSVSMRSAQGSEEGEKIKTLGDALQLSGGEGVYYAFRDVMSGLEYLRNGRDLCEKGLYLELGAYGASVFLDFRELVEDEEGNWGMVDWELGGKPVPSLIAEYRYVKHRGLVESLRDFLEQHVSHIFGDISVVTGREKGNSDSPSRAAGGFVEKLFDKVGNVENGKMVYSYLLAGELNSRRLIQLWPTGGLLTETWEGHALEAFNHAMYLAFRSFDLAVGTERDPNHKKSPVSEFAFDRAVHLAGETLVEKGVIEYVPGENALSLVETAMAHRVFLLSHLDKRTWLQEIDRMFSQGPGKVYLQVNSFEGKEYFNRERFHSLLRILIFTALSEGDNLGTEDFDSRFTRFYETAVDFATAARKAGYRVDLFLERTSLLKQEFDSSLEDQ